MDNKIKLYHGSGHNFSNTGFQPIGLRNNDSNMAITAGYYFTTDKDIAIGYGLDGAENKGECFIYVADIPEKTLNQWEYCIHEDDEVRILDLCNRTKILNMLKKAPNIEQKIYDWVDFDYEKLANEKGKFYADKSLENELKKIVEYYISADPKTFLNHFGNDFFNDSNEEIELCNQLFAENTGIRVFSRYKDEGAYFCFLNHKDVNQYLKVYKYKNGMIEEITRNKHTHSAKI